MTTQIDPSSPQIQVASSNCVVLLCTPVPFDFDFEFNELGIDEDDYDDAANCLVFDHAKLDEYLESPEYYASPEYLSIERLPCFDCEAVTAITEGTYYGAHGFLCDDCLEKRLGPQ